MKRLEKIFEGYLILIDQQHGADLGEEPKREITAADNEHFAALLDEHLKFNRGIIVVAIVLLCVLFGVGMFLVYTLRTSPTGIVTIAGGSFFSFLLVIRWLRRLWIEKSMIDVLIFVARDMPPKEAAKFLVRFYFKMLEDSKEVPPRQRFKVSSQRPKAKRAVRPPSIKAGVEH